MNERRSRVLVVDDTQANIDILVEILAPDYDLSVATNGAEALEAVSENPPDLVLLDVMMPEMDGWEVCKRLKADRQSTDIPVIFVTAKAEVQDELRGFELGAMDFITKPISPPVVRMRVASAIALKDKTDRLSSLSTQLGKYLSPQVYQSIFAGEKETRIGGGRKKLTVFLSDIVDFTETTERMEPEDMTELLNTYLERMSRIAMKHGGTIDKFIGDAILVFFGDPASKGLREDALACVQMALEMRRAIGEMSKEYFDRGVAKPFRVRMGINTGYCTVGNFGSKDRMDYTIIGGQVNVAARLENAAQPGQILISHETWGLVKETLYCIPRPPIMVKGVHHSIQTYQVVGPRAVATDPSRTIGGYVQAAEVLPAQTTIQDAIMRMEGSRPDDFVVVVDALVPVGIVSKSSLELFLCSKKGRDHCLDQNLADVAGKEVMLLEANTPLLDAVDIMSEHTGSALFTPAIVLREGEIVGVLPLSAILPQVTALAKEAEPWPPPAGAGEPLPSA